MHSFRSWPRVADARAAAAPRDGRRWSTPRQCEAGTRPQRFLASTPVPVIRVARDRHRRISALAEELDIPVAIQLGENFGAPYRDDPEYGAHLGSPLEEGLVGHPKLRLYVMYYVAARRRDRRRSRHHEGTAAARHQ